MPGFAPRLVNGCHCYQIAVICREPVNCLPDLHVCLCSTQVTSRAVATAATSRAATSQTTRRLAAPYEFDRRMTRGRCTSYSHAVLAVSTFDVLIQQLQQRAGDR